MLITLTVPTTYQPAELNYWLPLTVCWGANTLWCETRCTTLTLTHTLTHNNLTHTYTDTLTHILTRCETRRGAADYAPFEMPGPGRYQRPRFV